MQGNTTDYLDDLEEQGFNAGWRHANYAMAYAPDEVYAMPERPTGLSDHELGYYMTGYGDGICEYINEYESDDSEDWENEVGFNNPITVHTQLMED